MRDKISIIVPVYKVEKYLDKCVESIVNQTYKNLEIILVDDGSPDNCPKMCDEWAKKDERIKVIHKENGGVSSARNLGIDEATGEYVCFVDSDDWVEPNYAETLLVRLKEDKTDCVVCNLTRFGYKNTTFFEIEDAVVPFKTFNSQQKNLGREIFTMPWNKIYKTSVLKENNVRFKEKINFSEDTIFVYDYLSFCQSVSILSASLYNYNVVASVASKKFWPDMERYMWVKMESQKNFVDCLETADSIKEFLLAKFAWQSMWLISSEKYMQKLTKQEALESLERAYNRYFKYIETFADEVVKDPITRKFLLAHNLKGYYSYLKKTKLKNKIKNAPKNVAKIIYKKIIRKI